MVLVDTALVAATVAAAHCSTARAIQDTPVGHSHGQEVADAAAAGTDQGALVRRMEVVVMVRRMEVVVMVRRMAVVVLGRHMEAAEMARRMGVVAMARRMGVVAMVRRMWGMAVSMEV